MKKVGFLLKALCIILVISIALSIFVGCGKDKNLGKTLLKLGDTSISVNIYELYLSRMKGTLSYASNLGSSAKQEEFWDMLYDVENRKTYNDFYTEKVLEEVKIVLAILYNFDKLNLELPQATVDKVDATINEMMQNEANGSKNAFNEILSEYGVNYDMYREACLIREKMNYLTTHLCGTNGSKLSPEVIDKYYQDNYVRFKQIFLASYEYMYEEDENGDRIYFRDNDESRISYDTSATAKLKEDGVTYVTDKNGDRVYYYVDANGKERIAYDKKDAHIKEILDSNGEHKKREFSDSEMLRLNSDANAIMEEVKTGDEAGFDILEKAYNQDENRDKYPNGHYVSKMTDLDDMDIIKNVMEMEIGEVKKYSSDSGIHIIMRYGLENKGYNVEGNELFFISSETGTYSFMPDLMDQYIYEYVKADLSKITVDTELLKTIDIKRAAINFYY